MWRVWFWTIWVNAPKLAEMALFTAETAKIAAAKSWSAESARFQSPQEPTQPALPPLQADNYTVQKLVRVRVQLARLDDLLDSEDDPAKLDRLASAIARLSELERQLAGRPLPGSYRPMPERSSRNKGRSIEVWADTPQPVVSSVPAPIPPTPTITPDDVSH